MLDVARKPTGLTLDTAKIRQLREKAGLTMDQAAKAAGFTGKQHWYMIENGDRKNVTLDTLGKLAHALDCDWRELVK